MLIEAQSLYVYVATTGLQVYVYGRALVDRGDWSLINSYVPNNVVRHGSSNNICLVANTGIEPTTDLGHTYWSELTLVEGNQPGPEDEIAQIGSIANYALELAEWAVYVVGTMPTSQMAVDMAYSAMQTAWNGTTIADAAYVMAQNGTVQAQIATDIAYEALQAGWAGTQAGQVALDTAWVGTSLANTALNTAWTGTALANDALTFIGTINDHLVVTDALAYLALQTAWVGTGIGELALQTAWVGTSAASDAMAVAQNGTSLALVALDTAWTGTALANDALAYVGTINDHLLVTDAVVTVALATAWSGTALAYTALTTAWTGSQWLQEDFVGTAGQSTFTLTQTPQTVFVYINGMVQPVADYTTAAQTVVLVSGTVDAGEAVSVIYRWN